jgi:F-type H+-transporting ATPase subunit delta
MSQPERVTPKHETVMDVTVEQLARVYALAFLGAIAELPNGDDLVQEYLSLVTDVLDCYPQLEKTLESSLVSPEQKEQLLDRIFGKAASTQVLNFLKVVTRHGRLELLRPIARQVAKLHQERSGFQDVEIRVAAELDSDILEHIGARIQKAINMQPVMNVKVDPSLVGGIVVRVGDRLFDGSLRTQLEHVRHAMIERATEHIETQREKFIASA